jgi:hypothetical protein
MNKNEYARLAHERDDARRVFEEEMKELELEKFGEDIQKILNKFQFSDETRRQIFSQLMEYVSENARFEKEAGNPKKGNQK